MHKLQANNSVSFANVPSGTMTTHNSHITDPSASKELFVPLGSE